jgi:hypothetical protein
MAKGSWYSRNDPYSRESQLKHIQKRAESLAKAQIESQIKARSNVARTRTPSMGRTPAWMTPSWQRDSKGMDLPDPSRFGGGASNKPGLIKIDSKSTRRQEMFERAKGTARSGIHRAAADYAKNMHTPGSPHRSALDATRSGMTDPKRGMKTLPYDPSPSSKSRPSLASPRAESASPKIAGVKASSILRRTGALGVVAGAVGVALGYSDPAEALGATVGRAGDTNWARRQVTPAMKRAEKKYYADKLAKQRASSPMAKYAR